MVVEDGAGAEPADTGFRITQDHVDALRGLEGQGDEEFFDLATALLSTVFASTRSLSTAFLTPASAKAPSGDPEGLDLGKLDRFYDVLTSRPPGRQALLEHLERFLARPGPELYRTIDGPDAPLDGASWRWAPVLLECPLLSSGAALPSPVRLVVVSRLLGFLSSLPNAAHEALVAFFSSPDYPTSQFEKKVDLINWFVGERVRYWIEAGGLPGQVANAREKKGLQGDWAMRVGSRVMSLFCGSIRCLSLASFDH